MKWPAGGEHRELARIRNEESDRGRRPISAVVPSKLCPWQIRLHIKWRNWENSSSELFTKSWTKNTRNSATFQRPGIAGGLPRFLGIFLVGMLVYGANTPLGSRTIVCRLN